MSAGLVAFMTDVFDRTCVPLLDVPPEQAALGAQRLGADALVITGATFDASPERIRKAKAVGIAHPILPGGSVTRRMQLKHSPSLMAPLSPPP